MVVIFNKKSLSLSQNIIILKILKLTSSYKNHMRPKNVILRLKTQIEILKICFLIWIYQALVYPIMLRIDFLDYSYSRIQCLSVQKLSI